jgi:hypothetical protein
LSPPDPAQDLAAIIDDRKFNRKLDEEDDLDHAARPVARRWAAKGSIWQTSPTASIDCLTAVENHRYMLLSGVREFQHGHLLPTCMQTAVRYWNKYAKYTRIKLFVVLQVIN